MVQFDIDSEEFWRSQLAAAARVSSKCELKIAPAMGVAPDVERQLCL